MTRLSRPTSLESSAAISNGLNLLDFVSQFCERGTAYSVGILITLLAVGLGSAQSLRTVKKTSGSAFEVHTIESIPKAPADCVSEECEWWNKLRDAGNKLLAKGGSKFQREFVILFTEGFNKHYRVPVNDRPYQALVGPAPKPPATGARPKNGKVELSVEVMTDGSVGEIQVLKSLRPDLDEQCIQIMRQTIYLPAIRNHLFITDRRIVGCGSWFKNGTN